MGHRVDYESDGSMQLAIKYELLLARLRIIFGCLANFRRIEFHLSLQENTYVIVISCLFSEPIIVHLHVYKQLDGLFDWAGPILKSIFVK
jgi:hypothetical protein